MTPLAFTILKDYDPSPWDLLVVFVLILMYRIYSTANGKKGMQVEDWTKYASFIFFVWAGVFIIWTEAHRQVPPGESVFDPIWLAMVFTGLFSVFHMERMLEIMMKMMELAIQLVAKMKSKSTVTAEETKITKIEVDKKPIDTSNI